MKEAVAKVQKQLEDLQTSLNPLIDEQFKARNISALRTLTLAANALTLASTHLKKAVDQATPKAPKAAKK